MSKEAALAMLTGQPAQAASVIPAPGTQPGLLTPEVSASSTVTNPEVVTVDPNAPKDEITAGRLAIIAKREAQFHKDREAFKLEREQWSKTEKAQADEYIRRGKEFDELAAKDKVAALKKLGWSDTDIINAVAETGPREETPEEVARRIAKEEVDQIRKEAQAERDKLVEERNQFLINRLKTDISSTIKSQAEKYEYTNLEGAAGERMVYSFIEENLKVNKDAQGNPELLTVEQALQMAEEYYEERDKAFDSLKKRRTRLKIDPATGDVVTAAQTETTSPAGAQAARGAAAGTAPVSNVPSKRSPTLTNEVTATSSAMARSDMQRRFESEGEKKARLIEKLRKMGSAA